MEYNAIKITTQKAEEILFDVFKIKGTATSLPGEIDFNFRIKVDNSEGYILKISRPNEDENYLDFQQKLLQYVAENGEDLIAPKVVNEKEGKAIATIKDDFGNHRKVRLLTWISGRVWSSVNPQLNNLRFSLGKQCGLLTASLKGFNHKKATREFVWDVAQSLWTKEHIHLFSDEKKNLSPIFKMNLKQKKQRMML
ncbi:phosphotransferase [Polaribacter ponticola]|uniref:Phosphotransferase n=1 Tax=Polaribacter ponticola TaxID=2978475 RepID=A0ABT5S9Q7_9FLAO|nr:phosphotransferase [Polaribacter sp. MSW5]MDD7914848.1 phosphotransferase [Polaribacter sp. MSW5]